MRHIFCGLMVWSLLTATLHATVLTPTIASWGINGSGTQIYLPGSSISIGVSVSATRTNPSQDNSQPVDIYVSRIQNSIVSPAVKLGTVTCSIPGGNVGGGPVLNKSFNLPTTFNGTNITAGTYYIVFNAVGTTGSSTESSSFTIGTPDITLQSPVGNNLTNGSSTVSFGDTAPGQTLSGTFLVENPGTGDLTNITATINGANSGDFSFITTPATTVAPGSSSSFRIQFSPSATGNRTANLSISSSVTGSKKTFVVTMTGSGDASPSATTEAPSNITDTGVVLNGSVNANGTTTTTSFDYGATSSYGSHIGGTPPQVTGTTAVAVTANLSGLTQGATFHYRVDAVSNGGTVYGADQVFTTISASDDVPAIPRWGVFVLAFFYLISVGYRRNPPSRQ